MKQILKESTDVVNKDNVVNYIIEYEDGSLDDDGSISLFSYLIKSGMINSLQGSYGRTAQNLINKGILDRQGNISNNTTEGLNTPTNEARKVGANSEVVENRVKGYLKKMIREEIIKIMVKKKP